MRLVAMSGHRWRGGFLHVPHAFDALARPQARMPLDDITRAIALTLEVTATQQLAA